MSDLWIATIRLQ